MVVNFEGSVINLRDKISGADRKKSQSDSTQKSESGSKSDSEKQSITDVIGVRNENRLAVISSDSIKSKEDAFDMLGELKKQFAQDSETAINAHKKASPDAVMQFYPFE